MYLETEALARMQAVGVRFPLHHKHLNPYNMDNIKYSPEMAQTLADAMNWLTMKGWSPSMRWEHWNVDKPVITIHVRSLDLQGKFLDAMAVSITETWQIEGFAQKWRDHVADVEAAEKGELIESEDA